MFACFMNMIRISFLSRNNFNTWWYFKAAKKLDENGNPQANTPSSGGSVSFSARQLKPLSIYRHNPAFHSQHVSVNQMDEIPSLSPTSLQPPSQIPSTSCNEKDDPKKMSSKLSRRKKKVLLLISWRNKCQFINFFVCKIFIKQFSVCRTFLYLCINFFQ